MPGRAYATPTHRLASGHLPAVDGLRALAVIAVVVSHTGKHDLAALPGALATRWTELGTHGVELFFVISGFCLALPFLRNDRRTGETAFAGPAFFAGRIVRILPPYYAAVIVFALLALTPLWHATAVMRHGLAQHVTVHSLALHAVFGARDWEDLNASFWTLRVEAIWYCLFPALLFAYTRSKMAFAAIGAACAAAAVSHIFHEPFGTVHVMMLSLPAFMLGIVAADLTLREAGSRRLLWASVVGLSVVAVAGDLWSTADLTQSPSRLVWEADAFAFVALALCDRRVGDFLSLRLIAGIGVASYSIYLVHEPLIAMLEYLRVAPPLAFAAGLAAGLGFWWLIERPVVAGPVRRRLTHGVEAPLRQLVPGARRKAAPLVPLEPLGIALDALPLRAPTVPD